MPTFLQPNMVLSSRAAIFGDNFDQEHGSNPSKRPRSKRGSARDEVDSSDSDGNDAVAQSILDRLYGQLSGAIEIEDTVASKEPQDQNEDEEEAMEFRLFASQDAPSTITLHKTEPVVVHVHRERPDLDESPGSERMEQIAAAAIDAHSILGLAKIPWTRSIFAHKVIHVPFKQDCSAKKVKKSKRKREWEKRVKEGSIDKATIEATARKVKVSDSWGQPFLVRKGLDRNTIDAGTSIEQPSVRGGRGGRGGTRGGRGAPAGGGRGGHGDRGGLGRGARDQRVEGDSGAPENSQAKVPWPSKRSHAVADTNAAMKETTKKHKAGQEAPSDVPSTISSTVPMTKTKTKKASSAVASTSIAVSSPVSSEAAKPAKAPLPPKKPKAGKPVSKLDNIMAILTGK
ncbi:hypothetical protein BGZ70_007137 [Mortierella alpina]|uniref:Uncharacterized protein n=1 Tax=Mortierella alpina TaxID=64518 RepID=A0A9P6J7D7_MORAP|nr:hypothetical protein BGZ70_007137 [Mortierella alpina]